MTSAVLVAASAVLTYASRAAAVVFLPEPRGWARAFLERLPAPLFAGLAVFALLGDGTAWPAPPVLCATAAAVAVVRVRSLAVTLVAGLAGYALGALVW